MTALGGGKRALQFITVKKKPKNVFNNTASWCVRSQPDEHLTCCVYDVNYFHPFLN